MHHVISTTVDVIYPEGIGLHRNIKFMNDVNANVISITLFFVKHYIGILIKLTPNFYTREIFGCFESMLIQYKKHGVWNY